MASKKQRRTAPALVVTETRPTVAPVCGSYAMPLRSTRIPISGCAPSARSASNVPAIAAPGYAERPGHQPDPHDQGIHRCRASVLSKPS